MTEEERAKYSVFIPMDDAFKCEPNLRAWLAGHVAPALLDIISKNSEEQMGLTAKSYGMTAPATRFEIVAAGAVAQADAIIAALNKPKP